MAHKLHVIIGTTRPGRLGPSVATWFAEYAKEHSQFEVALVDIADFNLPVFDEPLHPRLQKYEHQHTKDWSASVDAADAIVFVTPEYDYFAPPALVNAVTYLSKEWNYKPVGFVSYAGVSGGLRAVQAEKLLLTAVKMMPIPEGVAIPMFSQFINEEGVFTPNELIIASAKTMLDELTRWSDALKPMRAA
jgi:NAD(P)H-dependent FMN reductase